jgi:hypothetical protein
MDALNAKIAMGKHKVDVNRADHHAERLEREASLAVDYAAASIEEAKYAVFDAIVGRIEADKVRRA